MGVLKYLPQSNFSRKDNLKSGDPDKMVTGAELAAEFASIQRALQSAGIYSYTIQNDWALKDSLAHLDPDKVFFGADLDAEFDAISAAIAALNLGISYTPTFDGAAADAADSEILGSTLFTEFRALETLVSTLATTFDDGVPESIVVYPFAALLARNQTGIGTPRTPDGFLTSGGVLTASSIADVSYVRAVVHCAPSLVPTTFQVRITGTDEDDAAITEDLTVATSTLYKVGTQKFNTITACTLLATTTGADAGYGVGVFYYTNTGGGDAVDVTIYGALSLRGSAANNSNVTLGGLLSDPLAPTAAVTFDFPSTVIIHRYANTNVRTFNINSGAETLTLPANTSLVEGEVEFDSVATVGCTNLSGTSVFVDIGIHYTMNEFAEV